MTDRRALLKRAIVALVLYVVAFAGLSAGGAKRSTPVVLVAVVCLIAAAVLLQLILSHARTKDLLSQRERLFVPLLIMAAGAALIVYWALGAAVFGTPTGGWGLCGLCALFLGAGQALTELRSRHGGAPKRGVVLIGLSALLFTTGLVLSLEAGGYLLAVAGGGLLLAPVGLTLLSEDVLRESQPPVLWLGAVLGAVAVVGGALLLRGETGIPWSTTLTFVGVLFLLIGAIASSTQADVLLVVTVVALIWATSPHPTSADDTIDPAKGEPTLVSLGDSYMSGEGAETFYEGTNEPDKNECRRSPTAYAHIVVQRDRAAALQRLAFFACSAAEAKDLYKRARWPGEPIDTPGPGLTQLEQLKLLLDRTGAKVRLVIVSIGGNDAGFSTIGMACLAPGSCVERGQEWLERLKDAASEVRRAYKAIRAVAGTEVPVLAVPYPRPISDKGCGYSSLLRDERRFLRGFLGELNGMIRQSARDEGFYYLGGMENAFADNLRICDGPEDKVGVNFVTLRSVDGVVDQVVLPNNWIHNSLHPNERGHRAMAVVLEDWLRAHPDPPAKPDPRDQPEPFAPASLPHLMGTTDISYCKGPAPQPAYCDRGDKEWTVTQIGLVVRDAAVPALLLAAGSWLLWLPLLALTRRPWKRLGDRIARRLLG